MINERNRHILRPIAAAAGILRCTLNRHAAVRGERDDDWRNSSIWNCGRRDIAGLLPADDAIAEPPPKSEAATRRLFARRRLLCRGRRLELPPVGSAAITPHSTAQAIPAIQAGAIAEAAAMGPVAAVMAAVEAIDDSRCEGAAFDPSQREVFRFSPVCIPVSLESLEKRLFSFASGHHFPYRLRRITERPARSS
jgi:hypothetical protein